MRYKKHILGMARILPPLNALKAFEAAGRHESFSRAADELNVSHSAISRHVRGLEDRLGVALFRDLPRGVELTLEGRGLLIRVMAALDEIAEATELVRQRPEGTITISCEPLFAQKYLVPRLSGFYNAFRVLSCGWRPRRLWPTLTVTTRIWPFALRIAVNWTCRQT